MLRTLEEKLSAANAALITIDVQNDFCNPDAPPAKLYGRDVSMHVRMIDNILKLVEAARAKGLPILHVRNEEPAWAMSEVTQELRLRHKSRRESGQQNMDYLFCQPGTFGADFYRLTPHPQDMIIVKHRYSAFFGTNLEVVLRSMNRRSLVFCGGGTNLCLESSVRDAFIRDFYCVVVSDCSPTPWGENAYKASLENIELAFGQVITLADASNAWRAAPADRVTSPRARLNV